MTGYHRAPGADREGLAHDEAHCGLAQEGRGNATGPHGTRHPHRPVHKVRPGPGAPRAHDLRALCRAASRPRSRRSRQGEGRGHPLRRTRPGSPAPVRTIEDHFAALVARNGILAGNPGPSERTDPVGGHANERGAIAHAGAGGGLSRSIRRRMSANRSRGMRTSTIWT